MIHVMQNNTYDFLSSFFLDIIDRRLIQTHFQPIISLYDGSILGYEALSRGPKNTPFESPKDLFEFAEQHNMSWELELLCRQVALENASKQKLDSLLFINVDPHIINDPHFKEGFTKTSLEQFDINPHQIVFEITEKSSVEDTKSFHDIIHHYKKQGYKIAIDDTGSGYSGLNLITDIHPNYIKLDMELIRHIDRDPLKFALVKALHTFATATHIRIIAEGIETQAELETLIDIGIHYGQGFYLGRGDAFLSTTSHALCKRIKRRNALLSDTPLLSSFPNSIGDLAEVVPTLSPASTGKDALDLFTSQEVVSALPIVDKCRIVGILRRQQLYSKFATQFGYDLFLRRPISLFYDTSPLIVDYTSSLHAVSELAMSRPHSQLYDYILVSKNDTFFGVVTIKTLLDYMTQTKIHTAKHLNPLTGLPGNLMIEQQLHQMLSSSEPTVVLYIDIDHFKCYNDTYGFSKGDHMIVHLASILQSIPSQFNLPKCFVGHIGGDDFVVIVPLPLFSIISTFIIESFESGKPHFYNDKHLSDGFIHTHNRDGIEMNIPIMSVSIAGILCDGKLFADTIVLAQTASEIKHECKSIPGSCFILHNSN